MPTCNVTSAITSDPRGFKSSQPWSVYGHNCKENLFTTFHLQLLDLEYFRMTSGHSVESGLPVPASKIRKKIYQTKGPVKLKFYQTWTFLSGQLNLILISIFLDGRSSHHGHRNLYSTLYVLSFEKNSKVK